jgi:hypothetical protein
MKRFFSVLSVSSGHKEAILRAMKELLRLLKTTKRLIKESIRAWT